jgi:hypothetical protein
VTISHNIGSRSHRSSNWPADENTSKRLRVYSDSAKPTKTKSFFPFVR